MQAGQDRPGAANGAQAGSKALQRACEVCGAAFTPRRRHARTCSGACRVRLHRARRGAKRYGVILADPPWSYARAGLGSSAAQHYSTMPTDAICALPVAGLAAPDAVLLLWGTWPKLPDALRVVEAWGFRYVTGFPWVKLRGEPSCNLWGEWEVRPQWGVGYWARGCSELVCIGVRGKASPPAREFVGLLSENYGHSRKPDNLHHYAESLPGPYLELFARRARPGWDVWGNEVASTVNLPMAS